MKKILWAVAIAVAVYFGKDLFRAQEKSEVTATAEERARTLQADARERAANAANLAAKAEEDRAIKQKAWDNAFNENYQAERDARWRELTSRTNDGPEK